MSYILDQSNDMIREECKLLDTKSLYSFMKSNKRIYTTCLSILKEREEKFKELFDKIFGLNPSAYFMIPGNGDSVVYIDNFLFNLSMDPKIYNNYIIKYQNNILDDIVITNIIQALTRDQKLRITQRLLDNGYEGYKLYITDE